MNALWRWLCTPVAPMDRGSFLNYTVLAGLTGWLIGVAT